MQLTWSRDIKNTLKTTAPTRRTSRTPVGYSSIGVSVSVVHVTNEYKVIFGLSTPRASLDRDTLAMK